MDKKQLEQQLTHHHREAYLWARQCCRYDDELAKDILQGVYLKIWEGRAKYHKKSAFRTWLFAVIRYTAMDSLREMRIPTVDDGDITENLLVYSEEPQEDPTDYEALLGQLPDRQAQVLLLAFYHNMTLEAISIILDVSLGTVRTHYDRGKKQLKELIEKINVQRYG